MSPVRSCLPPHNTPHPLTLRQGSSIELVITYLRKWLRIERTHVGRLLWSYPLDYSLPRLVLPADTAPADSSMDEANPPPGDSSTDSRSQAVVSSSSGDQQQLPKQVPLWGSAEACSWLPFDIKKIDGGSSGQQDDGSDTGDRPDSSAGGSSKQPPAPA